MKKILFFSCIAAALLSFVGCEETGNGYEGTNYIYLESEGGKTDKGEYHAPAYHALRTE